MADPYKLLIDSNIVSCLEPIEEQANKDEPKKMYVQGIFGQAGKRNKNGRIYDPNEMQEDIRRFNEEFVKTKRALNELNHPSTPDINLERACDMTVELHMESNGNVIGKALVLDTPVGKVERALIDGGVKLGKSSRALGQLSEKSVNGEAGNYVSGLRLVCFDSVQDPSVGVALVDPLLEQREWIMGDDGEFMVKPFENLVEQVSTLPKHNREEYFVECFNKFMKAIK